MPTWLLQKMDETIMNAIDDGLDHSTEFLDLYLRLLDAACEQANVSRPAQTRQQDLPAPHDDGGISMTRILSGSVSD